MEISNLSDAEFKTLVIRMLKELTGYFNSINKTQADMKFILSEIKKNVQGNNSGVDEAESHINDLEHKEAKTFNQNSKNKKENKDRLRSLQDNCRNGKRKQEIENLFEKIMKENFPNLVKEIDIQVQKVQRVPIMMDTKRPTPRHIIIKMPKVKTNKS